MVSAPNILPVEDPDDEYLRVKQDAFFRVADKRGYSRTVLASDTGISTDTLASYCSTPSRKSSIMSLGKMRRLIAAVPCEIGSILLDGTGFHLSANDPKKAGWLTLGEKAAALASKICRYQASGNHIDHREEADLREDIITIIAEGEGQVRG